MSDCLPCDLEAADADAIVFRDDTWACEVADGYDVPGWLILRLRRHGEGWVSLTPDEAATFGAVSRRIATAVQRVTGSHTAYFLSFGENYRHFHFLVAARPTDLAPEFTGAGILALRASHRDPDAARAFAAQVRSELAREDSPAPA